MADNTDVLVFVEDPGAANYVAQLPAALTGRGWRTKLLADGYAKNYLRQRGVCPEVVQYPAAADRILASVRPRLLIVGTSENPDTLGLALVTEGRSVGIESVGVIDALANADYRFRGRSEDPLAHAPDWLLVSDEWTKEAYLALGYPAERVVVCGHPYYDYVRVARDQLAGQDRNALRQRVLPGVSEGGKVVVFATEGSARLKPQQYRCLAEYTLAGRGMIIGRTEVVLEEFLDAIQFVKPRPYLVLRLHPKETPDMYAKYLPRFDVVSSGGSALPLLCACDLVVGLSTSLLVEAAIMGLNTLSILPHDGQRYLISTVRNGITPCATDRLSLQDKLGQQLRAGRPSLESIDEKLNPGATDRAIAALETLAGIK